MAVFNQKMFVHCTKTEVWIEYIALHRDEFLFEIRMALSNDIEQLIETINQRTDAYADHLRDLLATLSVDPQHRVLVWVARACKYVRYLSKEHP